MAETSQTLERGVRILHLLAGMPEGMSVTEMSRTLGVSRTIVYRLAVTLEEAALLRRGQDGRYRLGLGVLAIARQAQFLVRDAALPGLRRLAADCAATAFLAVADGDCALTVAVAEPDPGCVHIARRVGQRSQLTKSAAGLAIMASRTSSPGEYAAPFVVSRPLAPGAVAEEVAAAVSATGVDAAVGVLSLGVGPSEELRLSVESAAVDIANGLR